MHRLVSILLALGILLPSFGAEPPSPEAATPLDKAVKAYRDRDFDGALAILDKQIPLEPDKVDYYMLRGDIYSLRGQSSKAVENYDEYIKRRPANGAGFYRRGMEHFRLAKFKESIADFDKLAELHPDRAPELWQRGICYYYAGDFANGRKQFEHHQTVNKSDVENAVWHFLCVAKIEGFGKAREQIIPIKGDARVPMSQVFALFAGEGSVDDVLQAAQAGQPSPEKLRGQMFFAHLYLALYFEAKGDAKASLEHIKKAATEFSQSHYMGDVARVHLALREKAAP